MLLPGTVHTPLLGMQAPSPWMNQRLIGVDVNVAYVEGQEEGERGNPPQTTMQKREDFAPHFHGGGYIPQQDGAGDAAYDVIEKQRHRPRDCQENNNATAGANSNSGGYVTRDVSCTHYCGNPGHRARECTAKESADGQGEVHKIVRAIRFTIALRNKLKPTLLHAFLNYALILDSEAHTHLSAYLPKDDEQDMEVDTATFATSVKQSLPELEIYCYLLVLIFLIDQKRNLLALHRIATLRHDELGNTSEPATSQLPPYNLYDQAEKLRSKAPHFEAHSNQQTNLDEFGNESSTERSSFQVRGLSFIGIFVMGLIFVLLICWSTGGSRVMDRYRPAGDATAVKKVRECGGIDLCTFDMSSTGASKILDGYRLAFDATTVKKVRECAA
ncbi:hypothetical protein IFM89_017453 [Coptis chinensis]|uniref:26S proteasome non-ATPase regulatory subunit 3 N-terminal TPR repeats domain-containing protein n=1 Tax=Coptis chinensis TaxID=261450 RepID=A0A835I300_9MAGN|nr:hypothetical protein IFM89_017453 [Coptis chinensis]